MRLHLLVDDGGVIGKRGFVLGVLPEIGIFLHMNVVPHQLERFICLLQGSNYDSLPATIAAGAVTSISRFCCNKRSTNFTSSAVL